MQATFSNGAHAPVAGKLSFIDNSADTTTGTIKLKAEFPNTDKALWPGQFVNVVLTLYEQTDAVVAPSASMQNGPNGQYVFVVKPDGTVELRNIKIARAEGDETVVVAAALQCPASRSSPPASCGSRPARRRQRSARPPSDVAS